MRKMKRCVLTLSVLGLLTGCSKTVVVTAEALCKDWQHQTVSKDDKLTQGTAEQIEAGNKSRPEWGCEYGQNRAKS